MRKDIWHMFFLWVPKRIDGKLVWLRRVYRKIDWHGNKKQVKYKIV